MNYQAKPGSPLPIITINEPCPMQWNQMQGSDSKRFCGECAKHVYNFAELPAAEVQQILCSGEKVCAQIRRKPDGSLITFDDKRKPAERKGWLRRTAVLAASLVALLTFGGCNSETIGRYFPWVEQEHSEALGGKVEPLVEATELAPEEVTGVICINPEPTEEPAPQ